MKKKAACCGELIILMKIFEALFLFENREIAFHHKHALEVQRDINISLNAELEAKTAPGIERSKMRREKSSGRKVMCCSLL